MVDLNKGATVELVKALSDDIRTLPDGTKAASAGNAIRDTQELIADQSRLVFGGSEILTSKNFESGGFSGRNGREDTLKRIRIKKTTYAKKHTRINFDIGNLYYCIWFLSTDNLDSPTVKASTDWVQTNSIIVPYDCYIYIAIANSNTYDTSSNIGVNDFGGTISIIDYSLYDVITSEYNATLNKIIEPQELYLSDFIRAAVSAIGFNESIYRIATKDCVALPYGYKTKLEININEPYVVGIRAGQLPYNLSSNLYWFKNGDIVKFNNHEQYYRIIIANQNKDGSYNAIDIDELPNINLHIYYKINNSESGNVFNRNYEELETLINARNVLSPTSHGGTTEYPVIFHISDLHGDLERAKNAMKIAEYCDGDAIVISGDIVSNKPLDGAHWLHSIFNEYNILPVICTGNHDVDNNEYTDADVYNYLMQPCAEKINNSNGTTYYYTDIASKKIRIISTDIYQYGATTRSNAHMTSEQLAYICNALKTAPNGYGIIIISHSPCVDVAQLYDSNYPKFYQRLRKYGFSHYDIAGTPIYDIVDSFISRTTISRSYNQTGEPSTITVSDDFTNVDTSIEFIAHLTGHIHEDSICYLPTINKQLMLNVATANSMYGGSNYPYLSDDVDTTKLPYGKTQDIINAYVIDRANKKIKIVRIGAVKTYDMNIRDYMEIPYADDESLNTLDILAEFKSYVMGE